MAPGTQCGAPDAKQRRSKTPNRLHKILRFERAVLTKMQSVTRPVPNLNRSDPPALHPDAGLLKVLVLKLQISREESRYGEYGKYGRSRWDGRFVQALGAT